MDQDHSNFGQKVKPPLLSTGNNDTPHLPYPGQTSSDSGFNLSIVQASETPSAMTRESIKMEVKLEPLIGYTGKATSATQWHSRGKDTFLCVWGNES